ncbi:MAG: hypothetical protein K8I82_09425 [Anaerolineae bacterium]|nr:hypothetical protein [Anaerolineae bacterium]
MSKKHLLIVAFSLVMVFSLSGCLDLLGVPGVAVSPDGTTLYFLEGGFAEEDGSSSLVFSSAVLNSAPVAIGNSIGNFAVNPVTGEAVYNAFDEATETSSIMIVDSAGNSRTLVAPDASPNRLIVTMMDFSNDGSKLAMTAVSIPPEVDLNTLDSEDPIPPEVIALIKSIVYLVDPASGTLTPISNPDTQWANTLNWSPNGQLLAYNAWADTNGDGRIDTLGGLGGMMSGEMSGASDLSQIHIYSVADGSTTTVSSTAAVYSPVFLSDSQLGYMSADMAMMMFGGGLGIDVYDIASGTSSQVYQASGQIMGMALSPDGTQVAWTQLSAEATSGAMGGESGDSENAPAELYIADTTFASPRLIATLPNDFGLMDAPVWMPDGSGVFITSTSIFASVISSLGSMFSDMGESFNVTPEPGTEEVPTQTITYVRISDGSTMVVYEGTLMNGSFVASVLSMSGMSELDMTTPE